MRKKANIFSCLVLLTQLVLAQDTYRLSIRVENIQEIKGSLKVAVFNQKDQFLSKAVVSAGRDIDSDTMIVSFEGLSKGVYAVSIYQDENNNGKLDSNFMGIPTEPYAFSNNARGMFGPPHFEDCQFELEGAKEITIRL